MGLIRWTKNFLYDPQYKICKIFLHCMKPERIPDKMYLKYQYHYVFGKRLNLKNPQTFNEKLQWLKLYDRKPLYTTLVDKYAVKEWVRNKIGEQFVIPTLAVYNNVDEIDIDKLPEQFVLKCNHDSGSIVICKDKRSFNIDLAKEALANGLKHDFYAKHREWPYKNVPRKIIAEPYLQDHNGELRDYKFFCMNGKCHYMFIATERMRKEEPFFDFYDDKFNHLPIIQGHPNSPIKIAKPYSFELMKELSIELSKDIPNVRCDFYEVNGKPYFGEMTFFHFSGLVPFIPNSIDREWGKQLQLKELKV